MVAAPASVNASTVASIACAARLEHVHREPGFAIDSPLQTIRPADARRRHLVELQPVLQPAVLDDHDGLATTARSARERWLRRRGERDATTGNLVGFDEESRHDSSWCGTRLPHGGRVVHTTSPHEQRMDRAVGGRRRRR